MNFEKARFIFRSFHGWYCCK